MQIPLCCYALGTGIGRGSEINMMKKFHSHLGCLDLEQCCFRWMHQTLTDIVRPKQRARSTCRMRFAKSIYKSIQYPPFQYTRVYWNGPKVAEATLLNQPRHAVPRLLAQAGLCAMLSLWDSAHFMVRLDEFPNPRIYLSYMTFQIPRFNMLRSAHFPKPDPWANYELGV